MEQPNRLEVHVCGDGAAFEDAPAEFARILRDVADRLEGHADTESFPVRDINGNSCGRCMMFRSHKDFCRWPDREGGKVGTMDASDLLDIMAGRAYAAEATRDRLAREAGFDTVLLRDPNGRGFMVYALKGTGAEVKRLLDKLVAAYELDW